MKKVLAILLIFVMVIMTLTGCEVSETTTTDIDKQQEIAENLEQAQPTPTDIEYSLERYNLIRRAYWVNGMEEKARSLECPVEKPLSYIVLIVEGVGVMGTYIVDGKVSSLNSFLTPDSEYYEQEYWSDGDSADGNPNEWLADVDGSYGENDQGVFFFTPEGNYMEWTGTYLYSDVPFIVDEPILKVQEEK